MTGDPLRKVLPGQPIQIPAAAVNAWNDAARFVRNQQHNNRTGFIAPVRRADLVRVQNKSEEPRDRFDVLGIDGPIFEPSVSESGFVDEVLLLGVKPVATEHSGRFVVLLEPLEEDAIGWAVVTGVVVVHVDVTNEKHWFADVKDDDPSQLETLGCGSAEILWKEDGEGEGKWAVVRLGATPDTIVWGTLKEDLLPDETAEIDELSTGGPTDRVLEVLAKSLPANTKLPEGSTVWAGWNRASRCYMLIQSLECPEETDPDA